MADSELDYVIDGDTFQLKDGRRIRIGGVDAPENTGYSLPGAGGQQATAFTRKTLEDGFSLGPKTGETYGRDVHQVFDNEGRRLGDRLVRQGMGDVTGFADIQSKAAQGVGIGDRALGRDAPEDIAPYAKAAREQRAENLMRFVNGDFDGRIAGASMGGDASNEGTLSRAWDRGKAQLKASSHAFAEALGDVTGIDALSEAGSKGVDEAQYEAAKNPATIESWDDKDGLADVGTYLMERGVAQGPGLVADAVAGLATGGGSLLASGASKLARAGMAKAFLRRTGGSQAVGKAPAISASAAAKMGAAGSMYTQTTGGVALDQQGEGIDDPMRAFFVGAGQTMLEYASLKGILGDVSKRFADGEDVDSIAKWFGSTLGTAASGASREGTTEFTQALIGELNKVDATDGRYEIDPETLFEGTVTGATVGGTLGGVGGGIGNTVRALRNADRSADPAEAEADDETGGDAPTEQQGDVGPRTPDPEAAPSAASPGPNPDPKFDGRASVDETIASEGGTRAEPPSDLAAQIRATPESVRYISPSNVSDGVTRNYLESQFGDDLHVRETDDGGLNVSLSEQAVADAPVTGADADQAANLNYPQSKADVMARAAEGEPVFSVVERNDDGDVIRDFVATEDVAQTEAAKGQADGRNVEVVDPVQAQTDRRRTYEEQLAQLQATRRPDAQPSETVSTGQARRPTRIEFDAPEDPGSIDALANDAMAMGIDAQQYTRAEPAISEAALRRNLQSELRTTLKGDPDTTLREALDGRRLRDMEIDQLKQVARAIGMENLPKKAKGFKGEARAGRARAIAAVTTKLGSWATGKGRSKQGNAVEAKPPSDVAFLGGLFPKVQAVADKQEAGEFETQADYHEAVRRAMPSAQKEVRQTLAGLDDAQLAEMVQLTRIPHDRKTSGIRLAYEDAKRVDTASLRAAVEGSKPGENVGSRDTTADAEQYRQAEAQEAPDWTFRVPAEAQQPLKVGAVYASLTGETSGANLKAAMDSVTPESVGDADLSQANMQAIDGDRMLNALLANRGVLDAEQRNAEKEALRSMAVETPSTFAERLEGLETLDMEAFTDDGAAPGADTGRTTASGKGVSDNGPDTRSEQESSDGLFFGRFLNAIRYRRTENGVEPVVRPISRAKREGDKRWWNEGALSSVERSAFHNGRNLATLAYRDADNNETVHRFDMASLAAYAQGKGRTPTTASEAYQNLMANLSRMISGPEAADLMPYGTSPAQVQSLRSDTVVPPNVEIFVQDGHRVTFAEAQHAHFEEVRNQAESGEIGNRLDAINAQQAARRKALSTLVTRMMNGLDTLDVDARRATMADIDNAVYQISSMPGDVSAQETLLSQEFETALRRLPADEAQALAEQAEHRLRRAKEAYAESVRPSDTTGLNPYQTAAAEVRELRGELDSTTQPERRATLATEIAAADARLAQVAREREARKAALDAAERRVKLSKEGLRETTEPVDPAQINRAASIANRYAMTDAEFQRAGVSAEELGGVRSFRGLLEGYRADRSNAWAMSDTLNQIGRSVTETDPAVEHITEQLMAEGMQYDGARAEAERLAPLTSGVAMGSEIESAMDDRPVSDVADAGGRPMEAVVDEDGNRSAVAAPQELTDAEQARYEQDAADLVRQTVVPNRQRMQDLAKAVEDFKEAGGRVEQQRPGDGADLALTQFYRSAPRTEWVDGDAAHSFLNTKGHISQAHKAAHQRMEAARRAQTEGVPAFGENSRAKTLNRAFGEDGFRVVGSKDAKGIQSFVSQAVDDFRSTGRPVLVTVGQTSSSIRQHLKDTGLIGDDVRREFIENQLAQAEAGKNSLYMPMGDFVLVSLPAQPKRSSAAGNLRWYHQLGHELGHMVFDDYAQSVSQNRRLREPLYRAFEAQTGQHPDADPQLFKEWFADQSANEMIERSLGTAEERQTPFSRLADLMRGLWERIQYLLPRYTRTRSFAEFANKIREDQVARGSGIQRPTRDFAVERYDGATRQAENQAKLLNARLKAGVKKANASSVAKSSGRLFRTVIGRIESYSPELGKRLFTRSATDRSQNGRQDFQHMSYALRDRWTGQMERSFQAIYDAAGIKGVRQNKAKQAAVRRAFEDFESGRMHTRGAMEVAKVMEALGQDARKEGLRSVQIDAERPPVALDHTAVDKNRQAFGELLREAFPEASDKELGNRTEMLLDSQGQSEFAIAPGMPVSYHDTSRRMLETLGAKRLRDAGFLAEPSEAVFYHFVDGLAKRTAWEANFGGFTRELTESQQTAFHRRELGRDDPQGTLATEAGLRNEDGLYYDPNGEYHRLLDEAEKNHGPEAKAEINSMLDGVLGRSTSAMPRDLRNINDWVTAWTGWTLLAFSSIASIPELGLPAVRAHGRVGMMDGVRGYGEARRLAKDMGVVLSDSAERIVWQSMGDNYESSTLNKMGTAFFKLNGQQAITNMARTLGVSFGTRYLLKSAEVNDTQALSQLGLTPEDVRNWDRGGRQVWTAGADSTANETAGKVQAALTQFVHEGSSEPSKFQNPGWFNNPYFKIFWMIKRYMYAYGEGILGGMWRQSKRQWTRGEGLRAEQRAFLAAAPMMTFAIATLPLAAAGTEIREWLRPVTTGRPGKDIADHGGAIPYAQYLFSRAGGFGPLEVLLSMRQQSEWGNSLVGSFSPVVGKAEMLADWGADGSLSAGEAATKLRKMTPGASQFPAVWNKVFD